MITTLGLFHGRDKFLQWESFRFVSMPECFSSKREKGSSTAFSKFLWTGGVRAFGNTG